MADQPQSADQSTESGDGTPAAQISEPLGTLPRQPPAEQGLSKTEQNLEKVERDMSGFERSTLRWTRATFIILAVTCLFIGYQGYEIWTSSSDTHTLAEQAKRQADKMANMSDAADKISQAAQNMATNEKRLADDTEKSLRASNAQSEKVLDANIAAAHLEQRAWVAVINVEMDTVEGSKPTNGFVAYLNSGRTVARKVQPFCHSTFVPNAIPNETALMNAVVPSPETESIGVLAPNAQYKTMLKGNEPVSQIQHDLMAAEGSSWYTYVWGEITYEDIFGKSHETIFCSSRRGISGDFIQCPFHNDAN